MLSHPDTCCPIRFLRNKSQATAHNVCLLLYPSGPLKAALEREPGLYQKVFEGLQALDTDAMKGDGRVYGGGLFKMEPGELARVAVDTFAPIIGSKACTKYNPAVPAELAGATGAR